MTNCKVKRLSDGRSIAEHFAECMVGHAMKGNAPYMKEVVDRIEGKISVETEADIAAASGPVFNIIDNGRNTPNVQPPGGAAESIPSDPG